MSSHNYSYMCGCSACCRVERQDELREQAIQALLDDAEWVAANLSEADEWNDGRLDGEHYSSVERALADLAGVPADQLTGSDALATVLRLAKIHGDARAARLREVAEDQIERRHAA